MTQNSSCILFGDKNEVFTNCTVLTSDAKACPNEIYIGFRGYCFKHHTTMPQIMENPESLLKYQTSFSITVKCETCKKDCPLAWLAEHQIDCKIQSGDSV